MPAFFAEMRFRTTTSGLTFRNCMPIRLKKVTGAFDSLAWSHSEAYCMTNRVAMSRKSPASPIGIHQYQAMASTGMGCSILKASVGNVRGDEIVG